MSTVVGVVLIALGLAVFALRIRQRQAAKGKRSSANRQSTDFDLRGSSVSDSFLDEPSSEETAQKQAPLTQAKTGHVMALSIMASPCSTYDGYELLQALLTNGLRFGERNVFHRYAGTSGSSDILFSLVSIKNPGTFELAKMGEFKTPGLMLFMECDAVADVPGTFLAMKETAIRLRETLGGTVCDQNRQPLPEEEISHEDCLV